jgi:hypothetical protein
LRFGRAGLLRVSEQARVGGAVLREARFKARLLGVVGGRGEVIGRARDVG